MAFCSRLFSTGHLASSVSFCFSLWLWFTMLPAQHAILHPIPTGPWKGWWVTLCSISLALYHQSLHCCPGIVSSLIPFPYMKAFYAYDWMGKKHFLFHFHPFFLLYQPSHFFFSSCSYEVSLSHLFCAPDHRNRPQLLAIDRRNGIIADCWSNLLAMQRFATLWGFPWCFQIQPILS